jgi:hypothetical protein
LPPPREHGRPPDLTIDQGVHLPTVKAGCQKLRGQRKTERKYCTQLWNNEILPADVGRWGAAVLVTTPITMYITIKSPVGLKRVLIKFTSFHLPSVNADHRGDASGNGHGRSQSGKPDIT